MQFSIKIILAPVGRVIDKIFEWGNMLNSCVFHKELLWLLQASFVRYLTTMVYLHQLVIEWHSPLRKAVLLMLSQMMEISMK